MANYNVDIAVAVRNLDALKAFKRELTAVQRAVDDFNTKGLSVEEKKLKSIVRKREDASLKALQRVAAADAKALEALAKKELELEDKVFKDKLQAIKDLQRAEEKATKDRIRQDDREFKNRLQARAKFDKKVEASAKSMIDNVKKVNESAKELDDLQTQRKIKNDKIVFDARLDKFKQETRIMMQDIKRRNKFDLDDFNDRLREKVRTRKAADRKAAPDVAAVSKNREKRLNAALTAGAFPLLFGGGPGAALGGALGGAVTGQLFGGLTVVGQVIGSAVDAFVTKASQLGQALNPLTADLETVVEAAGYANTGILEHIKTIEDLGDENRALEIATEELKRTVGADGVQALQRFGQASTDLANSTAQVASQAFASIAAGLEPLTRAAAEFLKATAVVSQAQVSEDPQLQAVRAEIKERMRTYGNKFGGINDLENRKAIRNLRAQELQLVEMIAREAQVNVELEAKKLKLQQDVDALNLKTPKQLEIQEKLLEAGNDLTDERVAGLLEQQIQEDFIVQTQKELKEMVDAEIDSQSILLRLKEIELGRDKEIAALQERITQALQRGTKSGGKTAEQKARELKQAQELARQFEREVQLRTAGTEVARDLLEIQFQYEDRIKQINELENQSLATQQKKNAEALRELQIRERLAAFATTKTEGEQSRDDINRENSLLEARLQGREKEFLLNEKINELGGDFRNDLETQQDLQDRITGKEFAEQQQKQIGSLEAIINGTEEQFELQQKIQEIEDLNLTTGEAELIINQQKIADLEKQAELIQQQRQFYEQVGATIQSGIVNGIMSALDGSKSLSESLSGLLKQVGGMFLNVGIGALGQSMGIPGFKPFAQGGFVSSPTRALVGEGGQGEYIIPENRMRESMARYSRGARGAAVIPGSGDSGASGEGGGTAVAAPIDVRFSVERINNVDYVTSEEFQAGLQQAASQGAQRGQQLALTRLQQSPATRRRLGL